MLVPYTQNKKLGLDKDAKIPISILGSTGSIGVQTLEVVEKNKELFRVKALAAHSNAKLLASQVRKWKPEIVSLGSEDKLLELKSYLADFDLSRTNLLFGEEGLEACSTDSDLEVVVVAVVGFAGLSSVIYALESGKRVALANKESVVAGACLVKKALAQGEGELLPVDSEHSAIFQCLQGEKREDLSKLLITASGGPFRTFTRDQLDKVTLEQALKHPNWSMGAKITIDSATLMNKALELIEASYLFDVDESDIEVLVHPQSIVHSLIEWNDGSTTAQLGVPDMKVPIAFALSYPKNRLKGVEKACSLRELVSLDFYDLDNAIFPSINIARECLRGGNAMPAILNAANEIAVNKFLNREIEFMGIFKIIEKSLERFDGTSYESFNELCLIDKEVRDWCLV